MEGDEQLNAIVDAVPALIVYVDREQRYRFVNAAYRAWFGDVRGKLVPDVLGPDAYSCVRDQIERVLRGERVTFEVRLPFPDGSLRWVQADYIPDVTAGGVVRGYTAQLLDITDHKRTQERLALLGETSTALAASVDRDAAAQTIADAVVPALADWSAVYFDRFGLLVPAVIAHGPLCGDGTWQRARTFAPQPSGVVTTQGNHVVIPLVARGKRLAVLVLGTVEPRVWTLEDLLLAEELGRRASTALDVARLFDHQRRTNELLQEADRRKDEFLTIVGHELRNPLAPIVTALDVMEYRGLVGCERERAVIRRQAHHMSRLVEDLLDVARIRRGKLALHKQALQLHTIVEKAVELTGPLLEQRAHQLTVDVPRELVIEADATRMTQVFANLLTNAAKYTQARGHIAVTATRSADSIAVSVTDDGPGITNELLAVIFDPFVQGDRTLQRAEGGLGLGLSLVRSLTELHGGTATVTSDGPGRGACFTISLPPYQLVGRPRARGTARVLGGARLLLVDDNADAARALAELLREYGYDVAVAHDAPSALLLADEFRPEIALLDIGLPVMDGYELARHLRARLPTPPRLVAVTGYGDHADSARSREAGFDVHLGKPVDFEKLVSVLGSLSPS
ncbi:MAG TPA: ATP-binding protein [Kofleriaceae bacterium]